MQPSFEDLLAHYNAASPADRHFLYGVNCYQFALGRKKPVLAIREMQDGMLLAGYPDIGPGFSMDKFRPGMPAGDHIASLKTGLAEDGFRPIDRPVYSPDTRIIAFLYNSAKPDFHFCTLDGPAQWLSKMTLCPVETSSPDQFSARGYDLLGYFESGLQIGSKQIEALKSRSGFVEGRNYDLTMIDPEGLRGQGLAIRTGEKNAALLPQLLRIPAPEIDVLPSGGLALPPRRPSSGPSPGLR